MKRVKRPPGRQGKRLDKTKMHDMPQFQRSEAHDPHAPTKVRKVKLEDIIKREIHGSDEAKGIY